MQGHSFRSIDGIRNCSKCGAPENPNGKTVYLTFDDGPGKYTESLLNTLDRYDVKVTFFVVDTGYMHLLPRMAEAGHTVAMHSETHTYNKIYASENAFFNDLYAIQSRILEYTGKLSKILRFPGGSSNGVSRFNPGIMTRLTKKLKEMGYRYFDWNVDSNDAGGTRTSSGVYSNVINGIKRNQNSIVLQHDIKGYSVEAVDDIIIWGLKNGYTFKALDMDSPVCEHYVNN